MRYLILAACALVLSACATPDMRATSGGAAQAQTQDERAQDEHRRGDQTPGGGAGL